MSDDLKFVVKTLLRIPIIIFFSYLVFNIMCFFFIYFRMLGFSYIIMQTAVENNYLPTQELTTLTTYMSDLDGHDGVNDANGVYMVENAGIIVGMNGSTPVYANSAGYATNDARVKRQYGHEVTVGVACDYKMVWPFIGRETHVNDSAVQGLNDTDTFEGFRTDTRTRQQELVENDGGTSISHIEIVYTVPGLKYYPDLLTY